MMVNAMISKTGTSKAGSRITSALRRAALAAAVVGGIVLAAPLTPAWARKQADNNKFIPKEEGDSNVTAYLIVVVSMMMGMMAICRKSYRSAEPKRSGSEK
jgi:hypothetical protein